MVAEGGRVVVLAQMTGTHEAPFAGVPPTRHQFNVRAFQLFRVDEDGLIVEHWGLFDRLAMMEQLGVLPAPTRPGPLPGADAGAGSGSGSGSGAGSGPTARDEV